MIEGLLQIIKWTAVTAFFSGIALTFLGLMLFIGSMLTIALNGTIIGDAMGIMQIWLPFNLGSLYAWLIIGSGTYITYKISLFVFNRVSRFISV